MDVQASEHGSTTMGRAISIRGISKRFGETQANVDISFDVRGGSIHSIVGQNGAGKSTLMKILFGLERADAGTVLTDGVPWRARSPRDALASGVGLVSQELALIDELSALDNLILGHEPGIGPFLRRKQALEAARNLEQQLGFALPWEALVADLSIAQKQQIEVLRLLLLGVDTLIFDEPTAALAPPQVAAFLELLQKLSSDGRTIIFISHKLREVFEISDAITVLRSGRHVGTYAASDTTINEVSALMIGEALDAPADETNLPGRPVLRVADLGYRGPRGVQHFQAVSHDFKEHAITGLCGVTGNGQEEFMEALAGLVRTSSGTVTLDGSDVTSGNVSDRREAGITYVPPDRKSEGLAQTASIADNALAGFQRQLSTNGWLSNTVVQKHAESVLTTHNVLFGNLQDPVSSLSGGNQQKLMLGREVQHVPKVLLAAQPTRGVDIGGIQKIQQMLRNERDRGCVVILASEDLDELLQLSDELLVFYSGRLVGVFARPFDRAAIGNAMVGAVQGAA